MPWRWAPSCSWSRSVYGRISREPHFLVSFALTHLTAYLARKRSTTDDGKAYRSPWFPFVPIAGGILYGAHSFQMVAQPNAGGIALVWLGLGVVLYRALFSSRAEVVDAAAEAGDTEMVRLRGRSPLMLVPVHNPQNAAALVQLASVLRHRASERAPTRVARKGAFDSDQEIHERLQPLEKAMQRAVQAGHYPEAMATVATILG